MKKIIIIIFAFATSMFLTSCNYIEGEEERERTLVCPDECQVAVEDDIWVPVWCDEFEGTEIDQTKWTVLNTSWGGGNNEAQYYSSHNVYLEEGNLKIVALKQSYGGKEYTSGRLHSQYKGEWLYGKVVVRAKLPGGRGTWSAIWMLPTDNKYGVWPRSGEIDIMEYVGYQKDVIHGTFHTQKFNHNLGTQIGNSLDVSTVETEFHDYSMIWEPGKIELFVDDQKLSQIVYQPSFNQDVVYNEAWPFDQRFHLILNLAIGGNWGGAQGIDNDIFPAYMLVDYVRVYQKDYKYLDSAKPQKIDEIKQGNILKNMIYWNTPEEDLGIEKYEIYLDDKLHAESRVNSYVFTKLNVNQAYAVQIVAIDLAGNKSDPIDYTFIYK